MLKLTIVNQSGQAVPRRYLARWARAMSRELARDGAMPAKNLALFKGQELIVAFVSAPEARQLNKRFRQRDYPTDVLSFESTEPGVLGELVICPKVISRQAREHGLLVREELGYMILHGFLHLLGFDHERSSRQAKRMFELQDRVFEKLLAATSR